ncbi:MAG: hypothetical protein NT159_01965 [Proteobacteria bacterium]|nr:hypothetical protein [Pseudomonadota bacterium]
MEYFLGSVKLMLIVYALTAFIAMAMAWIIKLLFVVIRRRGAAELAAKATPKPAGAAPGKVS